MEIPNFPSKKELFAWLATNKDRIITAKKAAIKYADPVVFGAYLQKDDQPVEKANEPIVDDVDQITVLAVINTTNLMDGHMDVHIPGLWKKSLSENRNIMHLQEHQLKFDHIISDGDDLKAGTQVMSWKDLGQSWSGSTEALVFDSTVRKDRNGFMFGQYKSGRVKNHSVGMYYVKILMAINDKDYKEEYGNWNKYIDQVANRDMAEQAGYFFPVLEAKVIEGSAVPIGSNWITPTLSNDRKEPTEVTPKEPVRTTLTSDEIIKRIKKF